MPLKPIAYVMEQTLGNITHYMNLRRAEVSTPGPLPCWLPIDYREGPLSWTLTGSWLARRALSKVLDDVDGIFIHTTTLSALSIDYFRRKPTVLSTDGTLLNKRGMRREYGLPSEGRLSAHAKGALYRQVFAAASGLVAWSEWAKQSFVDDYGCREEDVAVIPPGVDLNKFSVGERDNPLPRLLFVGGDFERKGGNQLLRVFRERFRGKAELILVTHDAAISAEPGIVVHRNVQPNSPELHELYRTSDIFVLPTRADCYSLVSMEALAAGLPIVATRVGGIPSMIHEGETGHLVDIDEGAALGDAIESLMADPARRRRMATRCREDAEQRFDAHKNARRLFEFVRSRC